MARVTITGWQPGLHKIRTTKLIQEFTELGLRDAKSCTDRLLDGETIVLTVETQERAEQLSEQLRAIGAMAEAA